LNVQEQKKDLPGPALPGSGDEDRGAFVYFCLFVNPEHCRDLLSSSLGSGSPGDRAGWNMWSRPGDYRLGSSILQG
jgi:hypothetical protein